MTIDKQNPTQQRPQPLSLSDATLPLSTGDLGLTARSMPNSRRDPIERQAFLQSILEQAIELAKDVDCFFSEESISECADDDDDDEEDSRSQNQKQ
jgi:hypothetical protein